MATVTASVREAVEALYAKLPFVVDYQIAFPAKGQKLAEATLFLDDRHLPGDWMEQLERTAESSYHRWGISTLFVCFDESGEKDLLKAA